MGLTSEREEEIREWSSYACPACASHIITTELLIELDKVRNENVAMTEEIDDLRDKIERLRPCKGCPTVLCTCSSELEIELLAKLLNAERLLKEK